MRVTKLRPVDEERLLTGLFDQNSLLVMQVELLYHAGNLKPVLFELFVNAGLGLDLNLIRYCSSSCF